MVSKSGCIGWLKKRTNLEKTLLSMSSILLLTLLLMILIGVTYHGKKSDKSSEGEKRCLTSKCIQTAGEIFSTMDPGANSCTNFYDFACGTYGESPGQTVPVPEISKESVYFSLKHIMESNEKMDVDGLEGMRRFYDSCVRFGNYRQDVDGRSEALLNLMSEVGLKVWPIIEPQYDISVFSREHTLASLVLLGVPVVFRMDVIPDQLLSGSYLVKISPGGPRETGRSPNDIRRDVHLRSSILTSFLLLGASTANTDVNDILSVEATFAAIEQDKSTKCDVILLSPQEAVSELNRLMPEINWSTILSEIRKATGIERPFAVELHCKQKIRDYVVHLNHDQTERSEMNYLGWRFLSKFVEHVIPTFQKSQFGSEEVVPRWRVCLELMEKFSSAFLAEVLTEKMISKEMQDEVERIAKTTLDTAKKMVSQARWLSDYQKSVIREKVGRIKIHYPFQKKHSETEDVFRHLPQVHVNNFTAAVIHRQRQWVIEKFKRLNQEAGSSAIPDNQILSLTYGKTSLLADSIITIYFDKLTNPYLRSEGTWWINYGGFGVFVARQISKLIITMHAGENGNMWHLWTSYSNYSLFDTFVKNTGINTEDSPGNVFKRLIELVLDSSAIEIAYESAKSAGVSSGSNNLPGLSESAEKLFFLSYAQTLCYVDTPSDTSEYIPMKHRLNAVLSNLEIFHQVFDCESTSPRSQIWA